MLRLMLTFLQRQGLSTMALHCLDTRATTQSSFTRRNDNILSNISPGKASTGSDPVMASAVTDMVRANTGASWAGSEWVYWVYICRGLQHRLPVHWARPVWLSMSWPLSLLPVTATAPLPCFQSLF